MDTHQIARRSPPPGFLIPIASMAPEQHASLAALATRIRELAAGRAVAPLRRSRTCYDASDTFESAAVYTARGDNWLCTLAIAWSDIPRLEAALGVSLPKVSA